MKVFEYRGLQYRAFFTEDGVLNYIEREVTDRRDRRAWRRAWRWVEKPSHSLIEAGIKAREARP